MTIIYLIALALATLNIIYQLYYKDALLKVDRELSIGLPKGVQMLISENLTFSIITLGIILILMLMNLLNRI